MAVTGFYARTAGTVALRGECLPAEQLCPSWRRRGLKKSPEEKKRALSRMEDGSYFNREYKWSRLVKQALRTLASDRFQSVKVLTEADTLFAGLAALACDEQEFAAYRAAMGLNADAHKTIRSIVNGQHDRDAIEAQLARFK